MLIIGHQNIPFSPLYSIESIEAIENTPANSTLLFEFAHKSLLSYCQENSLSFSLHVKSITEACLANAMGASYLIVPNESADEIQAIANEYLFDAKVLLAIKTEAQINDTAKKGIDGVLFPKGQIKIV